MVFYVMKDPRAAARGSSRADGRLATSRSSSSARFSGPPWSVKSASSPEHSAKLCEEYLRAQRDSDVFKGFV